MSKRTSLQVLDHLGPAVLNRIGILYQSWLDRNDNARDHNMSPLAFHEWVATWDHVEQIRMEATLAEQIYKEKIFQLEEKVKTLEQRMDSVEKRVDADATNWDQLSFGDLPSLIDSDLDMIAVGDNDSEENTTENNTKKKKRRLNKTIIPKTTEDMDALFAAIKKYRAKNKLALLTQDWLKEFIKSEFHSTWEEYNVFYYNGNLAVLDRACHDSVSLGGVAMGRVEFVRGWTSLGAYEQDPRRALKEWTSPFIPRAPPIDGESSQDV